LFCEKWLCSCGGEGGIVKECGGDSMGEKG